MIIASGWFLAWVLLWRPRTWSAGPSTTGPPSASVVVPARNEAQNISPLLDHVRDQHPVPDQVIVVDDESVDATAAVVHGFESVTLLKSDARPSGWTGKCWACWQGARAADGEILAFLDADVRLAPEALSKAVAEQRLRGGLVSVQPLHQVGSLIESLSLPFNVVAVMGIGVASLIRPHRERSAAGPFMVCRRDEYERVGGHRAVRGEVVEDLALARRFFDEGLRVTCFAGVEDVRFRMYPGGLRDLVNGWTKNFATGARFTAAPRAAGIALWITASLLAAWTTMVGLVTGFVLIPTILYLAFMWQYAVLGRRVGRFGPAAAAWPLLTGFFVAVFTWSVLATLVLRRVRWRGRTVKIARTRPPAA